jgi:hypothetical protein
MSRERKETAYHEAGHAVSAIALGLDVLFIKMPPLCDLGMTRIGEIETEGQDAAVTIAGTTCETMELGGQNVVKTIEALYVVPSMFKGSQDLLYLEEYYNQDFVFDAFENAEKMLKKHWARVDRIAERLMTRDFMDNLELRRMW